ncbi:MAG TPA: glycosyltransferase family 39 protein, partial [Edaphobacter sp.]|nr:glycosyltransferase family 39 protein [Edaphobacter sp.]
MDLSLVSVSPSLASPSVLRRAVPSVTNFAERSPAVAFAILSAAYLLVVGVLSHNKVLWLDELITLHIAQLGSPVAIWNALAHAADPNPPLTHLAVLASLRIFGEHEFALRLPAILGYWAGLLALFLFLRRRLPAIWALAGVVFSMSNAAFDYSYESRSYGIFYGLAMLSVLFWSRAVDPESTVMRRRLALCGMTLSLAAGICTNYFAVLALFPIAGGELVRTLGFSRARSPRIFETRVWFALTLAATPLLAFRGLIQHSIDQFAPHAWNKVSFDQVSDSYTGMVEVIFFPAVFLLAFAALVWLLGRLCSYCRANLRPRWLGELADHHARGSGVPLPPHEAAATLVLTLYPFLGYLIASIHGGMLSPRFVIPVCLGFAIAGVMAAYQVFGHLRQAGAIALAICSVVFLGRVCTVGQIYHQQKEC